MKIWIGCAEDTPLGPVWTAVSEMGLAAVAIGDSQAVFARRVEQLTGATPELDAGRTATAVSQISAYLHGQRREFELPIDWSLLTPFQQEVLNAVYEIPYGHTSTYGALAQQLGKTAGASRAIGRANATNPMPLVIPCHRVLGSDGKLQGYGGGGGVETKAWLLRLEGSRLI